MRNLNDKPFYWPNTDLAKLVNDDLGYKAVEEFKFIDNILHWGIKGYKDKTYFFPIFQASTAVEKSIKKFTYEIELLRKEQNETI